MSEDTFTFVCSKLCPYIQKQVRTSDHHNNIVIIIIILYVI